MPLCEAGPLSIARKNGRGKKAMESEDKPKTAMASMLTSMEALTVALNTERNKSATTEGRTVSFEAEEKELGLFGGMVEAGSIEEEEAPTGGYFSDDT